MTAMLVSVLLITNAVLYVTAHPALLPAATQPRAKGRKVVANVNANVRSIFADDHGFMDRLACVESSNGENPRTYRPGYYGGIYQVDEIGYRDTKDVFSHPSLAKKHHKIKDQFGIDWQSTTYQDLLKPLYSGLAARLHLSNVPLPIPTSPQAQGRYWKRYYNTEAGAGDPSKFATCMNPWALYVRMLFS